MCGVYSLFKVTLVSFSSRLGVFRYLSCSHQHAERAATVAVKFHLSRTRSQLLPRSMLQEQSHGQTQPNYDLHEDGRGMQCDDSDSYTKKYNVAGGLHFLLTRCNDNDNRH